MVWTDELDAAVRRLRAAGRTWEQVSAEMGIGRNSLIERGKRLGARRVLPARPVAEARDRPPWPAGHPQTWGMITHGTLLQGAAYPFPVFL